MGMGDMEAEDIDMEVEDTEVVAGDMDMGVEDTEVEGTVAGDMEAEDTGKKDKWERRPRRTCCPAKGF